MTTGREASRLKDAYRLALSAGAVAYYREALRYGRMVQFAIDRETTFSDNQTPEPFELTGHYQLRFTATDQRPSKEYGVYGRLFTSTSDGDWVQVDGPWRVGDGPFDGKPQ